MSSETRYVFDTNVLVSALMFSRSKPRSALDAVALRGYLLFSDETTAEFLEVIGRDKIAALVTRRNREGFLDELARMAQYMNPLDRISACRDPKDDKFLELAVAGNAACIVTGDRDLLALHRFRGVSILTPEQFLGGLTEPQPGGSDC